MAIGNGYKIVRVERVNRLIRADIAKRATKPPSSIHVRHLCVAIIMVAFATLLSGQFDPYVFACLLAIVFAVIETNEFLLR